MQPVLIAGKWRAADAAGSFQAANPQTGETLPDVYPTSAWTDCDTALTAAAAAFQTLRTVPRAKLAGFLLDFAARIEAHAEPLSTMAHAETGYPVKPRLAEVELPRTTGHLPIIGRLLRRTLRAPSRKDMFYLDSAPAS